jgi:hypothetical protein
MKTAIATLKSISPYSQSKHHETEKLNRELHDAYEKRTWKEKGHWTKDGFMFVPPTSFKNCIAEIAKYLSMQIPGAGKQTFTKHFESGILVVDPLILPVTKENVNVDRVFVPSDGKRGGTKRVWKYFPLVEEWEGKVTFVVVDDILTKDIFQKHLELAGQLIGIGRWRPRNNGMYGRFEVKKLDWIEQ